MHLTALDYACALQMSILRTFVCYCVAMSYTVRRLLSLASSLDIGWSSANRRPLLIADPTIAYRRFAPRTCRIARRHRCIALSLCLSHQESLHRRHVVGSSLSYSPSKYSG